MAATLTFEIEIALTGTISPAEAPTGPTYSCGGTPGCDASVDDVDIADLGIVELVPAPPAERGSHPRGVWKTTSLLDGIDRNAPEIQKLFANILALRGDEAEAAIVDEDQRWAA